MGDDTAISRRLEPRRFKTRGSNPSIIAHRNLTTLLKGSKPRVLGVFFPDRPSDNRLCAVVAVVAAAATYLQSYRVQGAHFFSVSVLMLTRKIESIHHHHHHHPEGVVYRSLCFNSGTVAVSEVTWCIESLFSLILSRMEHKRGSWRYM